MYFIQALSVCQEKSQADSISRMSLRKIFIDNIKFYRKKAHISQQQLAEKCDMATNYLSEIETGKKFPSVDMIELLAKELAVPAYLLFLDSTEIAIAPDMATQKRNEEFSRALFRSITDVLKEFGF